MPSVVLYPSGNGTFGSNWGGTGSPAGDFSQIKDGSDSTYASIIANSSSAFWLLDNMPGDFGSPTSLAWSFRCQTSAKSPPRNFATIQITKADETTALTATANVSGGSTSITTLTGSLSITGDLDLTSWNGARLKVTSAATGSGTAYLFDVFLTLTYSAGGAAPSSVQVDRRGGLRGVCRGMLSGVNRIWVPRRPQILVPALILGG